MRQDPRTQQGQYKTIYFGRESIQRANQTMMKYVYVKMEVPKKALPY